MNKMIQEFEGSNVEILLDENGNFLFELYSTGAALGYTRITKSKGKEYFQIRKDRIDTVVKNAEISTLDRDGTTYLTESQLYDFMLEARTDKCRAFRKWVTEEVLPPVMNNDLYIGENATQEDINYESLYGKNRLKKTFEETSNPMEEYERFKKLSKIKRDDNHHNYNNESREKDCNTIIKVLEQKQKVSALEDRHWEVMMYQTLITNIQKDITSLAKQRQGGLRASQTRKLNKAKRDLEALTYELNTVKNEYQQVVNENEQYRLQDLGRDISFTVIDRHGFSNNKMYKAKGNVFKRTKEYNAYENNFPKYQLTNPSFIGHIDCSKPIVVELKFDHLDKFDVHNFIKPTIDIISRATGIDDILFTKVICATESIVDEWSDGKIYIKLYNI